MSTVKISKANLLAILNEFNVYKPCEIANKNDMNSQCALNMECCKCIYNDLKNRNIIEEM